MFDWIDVAPEGSLADGEHAVVEVDGTEIAVFRIKGEYFAIEDVCTHDYTPVAEGKILGYEIVCPRHGARFCLKTGQALSAPAYEDIPTYPVRVSEGKIQVGTEPNA